MMHTTHNSSFLILVIVVCWVTAQRPAPLEAQQQRIVDFCPDLEALGYEIKPLSQISLDISMPIDRVPSDCSTNLFTYPMGFESLATTEFEYYWVASGLYHQPLYFDDTILERYGQSRHRLIQPIVSGAHFFGTFPFIPYKIGLDRTHDIVYTLGLHRPGSPTPCISQRLPWEVDAAGFTAATALGLIFLLP